MSRKEEKFIDKEKLLKEAVQSCLVNVKQYFDDARLLVENGSYGHAFAFVVLGEEELSKAYIYHECSEGFLPHHFIYKMGKGHESHKRKQAIQAVHFGTLAFIKSLPYSGQIKTKQENLDQEFERMIEYIKKMGHSEAEKQNGLYVDLNLDEGVIVTPEDVTKQTVLERLNQAEETLRLTLSLLMRPLDLSLNYFFWGFCLFFGCLLADYCSHYPEVK